MDIKQRHNELRGKLFEIELRDALGHDCTKEIERNKDWESKTTDFVWNKTTKRYDQVTKKPKQNQERVA